MMNESTRESGQPDLANDTQNQSDEIQSGPPADDQSAGVRHYLLYGLSLPERALRATTGAVGGAVLVPHVLNMDGLVFPVYGRYAFDVRVDGEHQVSIPLTVHGPESSAQA